MNVLIVTPEQNDELRELNLTGDPDRQLQPMPLTDGRLGLNADVLADCNENQTWSHYRDLLQRCTVENVDPSAFASANLA